MKVLVLGLDCAAPEILLEYEELPHLRHLMQMGCYGRLESVVPPITVPAWMCMATSKDPGTLGVYGFRNRGDRSYQGLEITNSSKIRDLAIWDQMSLEGRRSILIGVPPSYPARKLNGVRVGCFLTPDTDKAGFTYPESVAAEIEAVVGEYPVDVKGFRTDRKAWLKDEIFSMSRKQFQVVRYFMEHHEWDYLQYVDIGLDRIQHGFWEFHDREHVKFDPDSPHRDTVLEYYRHLDKEIGDVLSLLTEDTSVLVLSDHGAQRLDGGFCVNEWLIQHGLLTLKTYPDQVSPWEPSNVDWEKTVAWGAGGYYARIFLNVMGREPKGAVAPEDYEQVRTDLKERLEGTVDDRGRPLGTKVFRPEESYAQVNNIAPDLIVYFGDLYWRSIGSLGHRRMHTFENDTGPDGCNHAQHGAFILASPGLYLQGELEGVHLLDMTPTLLELSGCDSLHGMQGQSLASGNVAQDSGVDLSEDEEEILRERLSGLGYIS